MTKAKAATPTTETAEQPLTDSQLLSQAHSEAVTRLVEEHREEFHMLKAQGAQARGLTWKPRPSKEEREAAKQQAERAKAQAKVEALLEKHPELKDTFAPVPAENQADVDDDGEHETV